MDTLGTALAAAAAAALWVAAVLFGHDSRDGRDWLAGRSLRQRPPRTGD